MYRRISQVVQDSETSFIDGESSCFYPQRHELNLLLALFSTFSTLKPTRFLELRRFPDQWQLWLKGSSWLERFCPGESQASGNSPPICKSFRRKRQTQAVIIFYSSTCFRSVGFFITNCFINSAHYVYARSPVESQHSAVKQNTWYRI